MQYDLYLVRGSLGAWSNFRNWQNEELGRLELPDVIGSASSAYYQPTGAEITKAADVINIIEVVTDGDVALDLVFESPEVIGMTIAYWSDALPKLGAVAARLNEFSQALEGKWIWADPQSEKLLSQLSSDDISEVFCDFVSEDCPKPEPLLKRLAKRFSLWLSLVS